MKTYDANALKHLDEINSAYEGQIVPFFSRGHVHVARNPGQAKRLNELHNRLRFEFEVAALQTIESAEHLSQILRGAASMIDSPRLLSFAPNLTSFELCLLSGSAGRLPDSPVNVTKDHIPFQANGNRFIAHLKITPVNNQDEAEIYKEGSEYFEDLAACFLTVDAGNDGTYICIEKDELSESGLSPSIRFDTYYRNAKGSLEEEIANYPKPHIWCVHNNYHVVNHGLPEEMISGDVSMRYRPRAVDIASVMNYCGADSQELLTLPALLQKYEGMGKLGFGSTSHPAIRKDMLTLVFDAARQELFDPNGQPKSGSAIEIAKQLRLLPTNFNIA